MRYSSTNSFQSTSQWNPQEVFELIHPFKNTFTCVGWAPSKQRRCMMPLRPPSYEIILHLAKLDPAAAAKSSHLERLASDRLCSLHGEYSRLDQSLQIASKWQGTLRDLAEQCSKQSGNFNEPFTEPEIDINLENIPSTTEVLLSKLLLTIKVAMDRAAAEENWSEWCRHQTTYELTRRLELEVKQYLQTRNEREEQAAKARKAEEERKRQQQRKEEEERKRQQQRKEEEAKRAREAEEKARRQREKAAREERERKEAEQERAQWTSAWTRYTEAWETIEAVEGPSKKIPWPTRSGKLTDVTEENVREFFRRAPPTHLWPDQEEKRFQLMVKETTRWHTDKILARFDSEIITRAYEKALNEVARIVIELRADAKLRRGKKM